MDCWQLLKQKLFQLLEAHSFNTDNPIIPYHFSLVVTADIDVLAWLKGQIHYPRFFWQPREQQYGCAALGAVRHFTQLDDAQQFLKQYASCDLQLVGGLTFEGEACFYLPRLWLQHDKHELKVTLMLQADDQLAMLMDFMAQLHMPQQLNAVTAQLQLNHQSYTQDEWQNLVEAALCGIQQGKLTKIVLAQQKIFRASGDIDPHDLLAQARRWQQGCYYFLWAQTDQQIFFGVSPERLYQRQQQYLFTEALAGTAGFGDDPLYNQQQLQWLRQDSKNIHENWLVVQDICDKLSPLSQHLDIHTLSNRTLRYVQHLARNIDAKLYQDVDDQACLTAIHPSAAVGGLPYERALQFIAERQNFKRSWYAGTLGVMSLGHSEFCVAIRSALLSKDQHNQDKIAIFSGAGIVAGSIPLLEWQEIERKAAGMLSLFPVLEGGG